MAETEVSSVSPARRDVLRSVLSGYSEQIDRVAVFGSHALGRARDNSDIDLVIYGQLTDRDIDRLWTLFDSSQLSVPVDVVHYRSTLYPPLKNHIDAVAKTLFTKQQLQVPR